MRQAQTNEDIARNRQRWNAIVPAGEVGSSEIVTFSVGRRAATVSRMRGDNVAEGDYTKLVIGGELMMSDTEKEYRDHSILFFFFYGHVLVNGLGLGCCLNVLLGIPEVTHVTVHEVDQDVIDLVLPSFSEYVDDGRLTVERVNALSLPSHGSNFETVWHDIWISITGDNFRDMVRLVDYYDDKCLLQGCWSLEELDSKNILTEDDREWLNCTDSRILGLSE